MERDEKRALFLRQRRRGRNTVLLAMVGRLRNSLPNFSGTEQRQEYVSPHLDLLRIEHGRVALEAHAEIRNVNIAAAPGAVRLLREAFDDAQAAHLPVLQRRFRIAEILERQAIGTVRQPQPNHLRAHGVAAGMNLQHDLAVGIHPEAVELHRS